MKREKVERKEGRAAAMEKRESGERRKQGGDDGGRRESRSKEGEVRQKKAVVESLKVQNPNQNIPNHFSMV